MESRPRSESNEQPYGLVAAESVPVQEVQFPDGFPPERLDQTRLWIERVRRAAEASTDAAGPFLVVTPLGMPLREIIASWLTENGYDIVQRVPISDWPAAATILYPRSLSDERMTVAMGFEDLWRSIVHDPGGERWDLADANQIQRLDLEKDTVRALCGLKRFRVHTPTVTFHARLQALHVPDPDKYALEGAILMAIQPSPTTESPHPGAPGARLRCTACQPRGTQCPPDANAYRLRGC